MATGIETLAALPEAALDAKWRTALAACSSEGGISDPQQGTGPAESLLASARRAGAPEPALAKASAEILEISVWEGPLTLTPSTLFVKRFPISFARQHAILALEENQGEPIVAMPGVEAWPAYDSVRRVLGRELKPLFAAREEILRAINRAYEQQSSQPDAVLDALGQDDALSQLKQLELREDLLATDGQAPVVELVNLILLDAVKGGASDVHFQPYRENLVVRYRIDGVLFDAHTVPKTLQDEVTSRIKVMGKMDIAEKRLPQDGRATVTVGDRTIDLRIASLPGSYGERVVLRLLDKSTRVY